MTYTLAHVVEVRSYSRISGTTSDEHDTGTAGRSWAQSAASARSWAGLRYACRRQIATASTPASLSRAIAARAVGSSRGVSTPPAALMRSPTSSLEDDAQGGEA